MLRSWSQARASAASWSKSVKTRPLSKREAYAAVARPGSPPPMIQMSPSSSAVPSSSSTVMTASAEIAISVRKPLPPPAALITDAVISRWSSALANETPRLLPASCSPVRSTRTQVVPGVAVVASTELMASVSSASDSGERNHSGARRAESNGVARSGSVETSVARPGSACSLARFICTVAAMAIASSKIGRRSRRIASSG